MHDAIRFSPSVRLTPLSTMSTAANRMGRTRNQASLVGRAFLAAQHTKPIHPQTLPLRGRRSCPARHPPAQYWPHAVSRAAHDRQTPERIPCMKLTVLGCDGGIGGARHTTCLKLGAHALIDAGTGLGSLSLAEMAAIDHVFLSHAHLDHVALLPLLVDSVGAARTRPLEVHGLPATLDSLRQHIFNWQIWPDFSQLPSAEAPWLQWRPLAVGERFAMDDGHLTALPAHHTVPAVAYRLEGPTGSLVFSGDTSSDEAFWQAVLASPDLRHLLIECAFPDEESRLAGQARHYSPSRLAADLAQLPVQVQVWISHLKPTDAERTLAQIAALAPCEVQALAAGVVLTV